MFLERDDVGHRDTGTPLECTYYTPESSFRQARLARSGTRSAASPSHSCPGASVARFAPTCLADPFEAKLTKSLAAGGGGARFVPTFCASAGRLGEPHATLDGVHADDRINWAKAQLVLGELCEA